ncbi:MAG: ATP-binding protein [Candidatus Zixiibacteriota bacterium]
MLNRYLEVTSFRYSPGKFATVMADVTERRKAEDALRESEVRFRQIAENMRECCWLMDIASFKMIFVNKAHEEMYGYPADELYEDALAWMKYVHPDDKERVKSIVEKNAGVFEAVDLSFRIVRPDGALRSLYSRAFPILDASGKPYRLAGIIEDITLLKEAELKLQEHAENLERKVIERSAQLIQSERLANLGRLVAGVAHEINNPVQTITSHLQAIEEDDTLPRSVAERLKSVQVGLNRISSVTQQLRHMYRENPRDVLAIDIRKVVSDVMSLYSSQLREQGIGIQITLSDQPCLGLCNEGAIHEALGNLLVNAMDAMPEGGKLEVRLDSDHRYLQLAVIDTGCGISSTVIDRIFEPFFTTKPVGSGTGLGLAISRESLESAGCSISVSSDGPGRGATFIITIPALSA